MQRKKGYEHGSFSQLYDFKFRDKKLTKLGCILQNINKNYLIIVKLNKGQIIDFKFNNNLLRCYKKSLKNGMGNSSEPDKFCSISNADAIFLISILITYPARPDFD
ncbi:hypothetical protein BpHYR1_015215 [Brachionus plicatilis]|uniref:Uncharacterized protein n=1 Tax=Brachionus plicatilis TaxID=10195 RepID=A0A3M7R7X5_BRAPC|nr:hypothetical protein BpHYR1_015215 [Brachionus plicatilis]